MKHIIKMHDKGNVETKTYIELAENKIIIITDNNPKIISIKDILNFKICIEHKPSSTFRSMDRIISYLDINLLSGENFSIKFDYAAKKLINDIVSLYPKKALKVKDDTKLYRKRELESIFLITLISELIIFFSVPADIRVVPGLFTAIFSIILYFCVR